MSKRIIPLCVVLVLLCGAVCGILFFYSNETEDLESQEQISELVAEEYLIYVSQQDDIASPNEGDESSELELPSDLEYDDNEIYSYFDESYAHGYVDCVLEIPAIDLRQSIFTGTVDQIQHDLGRWLSVTARSDYVLGDTHYCIYMHNPRNKSIKISFAQEKLHEKDYMVVTKKNTVYLYEVTGVFPEWRNKCSDQYVNNMTVDSDRLYIFTCGRGEWQGRNVVIEGTVHSVYTVADWVANKDQHIYNYKEDVGTIVDDNVEPKEPMLMDVKSEGKTITVSLRDKNYKNISNCVIGICNSDGYLLNDMSLIPYNGDSVQIDSLPEGEYYIGVFENNTEYSDPAPCKVVIDKTTRAQSIITVDKEAVHNNKLANNTMLLAICMLGCAITLGIVALIKIIIEEKKKKK